MESSKRSLPIESSVRTTSSPNQGDWQPASRTIGYDFAATLATNFVLALVGIATGSLVARLLLPTGRGEFAAIQLWPLVSATLATMGLGESVAYFSARDMARARCYLSTALCLAIVSASVLGAIMAPLVPLLLHRRSLQIVQEGQIYLAYLPIYAAYHVAAQSLRGVRRFAHWNILRMLPPLGWLAILLWYSLRQHSTEPVPPTALADGYLVTVGIIAVAIVIVAIHALPGRTLPRAQLVPGLVRFGLPVLGSTLPMVLNFRLDQLVMIIVVAPRQLGLYVAAAAWGSIPLLCLNSLGSLILPRVASLKDRRAQATLVAQAGRVAVLLATVLVVPCILVTPPAIRILFGPAFIGATSSAMILVLAGIFLGMNYILTEALLGLGDTAAPLRAQTIGFVTMGASLAGLLPTIGILGAALSSLIGYSTNVIALFIECRRSTQCPFSALTIPRKADLRVIRHHLRTLLRMMPLPK